MTTIREVIPEAPPLVAPQAEPTKQVVEVGADGAPLGPLATCRFCGGLHPTICPFITIAEWHPGANGHLGQLARVVLEERPEQKKAIHYPFEDDEDALRSALTAITEAATLETAQGIASTLLQLLTEEQASA